MHPTIPRALNMAGSLKNWDQRLEQLHCNAFHCDHRLLDKTVVEAIIQTGYTLRCFTVNEVERGKALLHWGVHSIFTDYPDRFL